MMTLEDVKRMKLPHLTTEQIRRLTNAENSCRIAGTDWSKNYWYGVFKKLCEKYNCMDYFRKVID